MIGLRRARPLLGTVVEIGADDVVAGSDPGSDAGSDRDPGTEAAIERAFDAVARIHALMSFHDPASEISRLNREAAHSPVEVSEETWQVLHAAQRLSAASHGVFDITVAPLLVELGFLPRPAGSTVSDWPSERRGDWRDIKLLHGRRVWFTRPLCVDVGGIAKGFAVDQAVAVLRDSGVRSGRVNAGGDLRVFGAPQETLHARHPAQPTVLIPLPPVSAAVATSAGYYRHRDQDGREVCPLVHPHTEQLCDTRRSVTVYAEDCTSADALTKVVSADPERAAPLLVAHGARAIVLEADPASGGCRVYDSAGGARPDGQPGRRTAYA